MTYVGEGVLYKLTYLLTYVIPR